MKFATLLQPTGNNFPYLRYLNEIYYLIFITESFNGNTFTHSKDLTYKCSILENIGFSRDLFYSQTVITTFTLHDCKHFYINNDTKFLWTHQLYADTRFQNNLYPQVKDRQVLVQLLRRWSVYKIHLLFLFILLVSINCAEHVCNYNHYINEMVFVTCCYYYAIVMILYMTSSTPEHIPPF